MENIISSLLNIKEQMEHSLQRFDALQQHFKDLQTSYNKMHQIFRQSLDEFEESFYQLEDRICEIEEEDAVAVEENEAKDEIKTAQFTLSHVPKNPEPFPSFSDLPLITSRPSLRFRNYFFSSSSLSVVSSNNYLTVRREALAIRWEFDPSGIYFQCTNTPNPSPFKDRKGISPNKQLLVFNVNGKITLTLCAQLGISSILSVAISNGDPLIERGLTIIWEFDPGGVDHGLQDFNCFLFSFSCDGERMNSLSFPLHSERTVTHQIYSTTQPVVTSLMLRDSMASTTAIRRPFSPRQPICTISLSSIGLTTQKKKSLYYHLSNPYDISAAEEALSQSSPPGLQDEKLVKWVTASQPDFVSCQKYAEGVASVSMVPSKGTTQQIEFQVRKIQCVHKPRPATVPINLQNLRGKKFFPPFILDVFPLRDIAIYGGGDGEVLRVVFLHSSVEYIDNWEINKMGVDVSKQYFPGVADCFEPNVFDEMLEKSIRSDKVRFLTKPILIICNVFLNIYGKLGMPWNKIVLASTLDELQMGLLNGVGLKSQGCATTTVIGNKAHLIGGVNDEPLLSSGIHIFNQTVGKLVNPIVPGSTPDVCIWFLEVGILFVRKLRQLLGKEVVTGSKVVRDNVDKLAVFGDPFGIGKGKLISMLMKEFPSVLGVSVRHRTWPSKGCGRDGVHYHFTEPNALKERERNDGKDKSAQDYFVSFKAICMGCAGDGVEDGNFDWITDDELEANNSQLQRNRGGHTAPCGQGASMGDDLSQSTNGMVGPGLNQAGRILSFLFSFTCFPLCYVMKWATR